MSELKEKKEVKAKSKKKSKGKKKGKINKPGKKELVHTGPPQKPEDFSSNWKAFLETQQSTQTTNDGIKNLNLNKNKNKKRKVLEEETQQNSTKPKKKKLKKLIESGDETQQKKTKPHKKKRKSIVENGNVNKSKEDIWFDVDPKLLEKVSSLDLNKTTEQKKDGDVSDGAADVDSPEAEVTRRIAIDCEMVGVGFEGKENVLARVSIVNSKCQCVYDKYVMSEEKVVDYRTHVSGIRPSDLIDASEFSSVQKEVCDILKDRVLVGHAVHNDLKVLLLSHPKKKTRDTQKYKPFRKLLKTKRPALKRLAEEILRKEIQVGEHDSVKDAQVTMELYNKHRKEWEKSLRCRKEDSTLQPKEIYMGNQNEKKKTKMNKWKKIKDRKKKKKKLQEEE